MVRRPPSTTRTDTLFPTRRASDLDGSDTIRGNAGDDIIDGDKWLNVRISVREAAGPDGGIGAEIATADSMSQLVTRMFNRTFNPGQLVIVREILADTTAGDTDIAVFSDQTRGASCGERVCVKG